MAHARAWQEGDPLGVLRNVVCSEVTLITAKVLLGAEQKKLPGQVGGWAVFCGFVCGCGGVFWCSSHRLCNGLSRSGLQTAFW